MSRRGGFLATVAALALVTAGCTRVGGIADRPVRLPQAVPIDLPLPENAALRSSQDLGDRGINLVFETDESVPVVFERLRSRLVSAGWSAVAETGSQEAVFISYRKGDRTAAVGVSRAGGVTVIGIAHQQSSREEGGRG